MPKQEAAKTFPCKTTSNNLHDHENNHNLLPDDLGSLHFGAKSDSLLAKRTLDAGVWNTPTLTIYTQLPKYNNAASNFFARPEVRYVSPILLGFWQAQQAFMPPELLSVATAGETARKRLANYIYPVGGVAAMMCASFIVTPRVHHESEH